MSSYGDRVTGTEKAPQATRKEIESLKSMLVEAQAVAKKGPEPGYGATPTLSAHVE